MNADESATLRPLPAEMDRICMDRVVERHHLQGFQVVGFDWRYLYLNPAAARHGGHASAQELVGRTMMDAFPGIERTALFSRLCRCLQERRVDAFDNEFVYADGTTRWFDIRLQPVPEGLSIYSNDIHDRKVTEERLQQQIDDLSRQAERRRGVFAKLWSNLRSADRA